VSSKDALKRNRFARLGFFGLGVVLFYAPFALLVRAAGALWPASLAGTGVNDVHTACLRMPLGWLTQPWMWPTMAGNPISYLPVLVLPAVALAAGPLFCGWLCPAGAFPEFLGRLVPERFKYDLKDHVSLRPVRYGFFVGFLLAPFVSASICCSFCNFTHMQNIVSAVTGDLSGLAFFSSLGVVAALVWIVPLGLFTTGGRGWCLTLCPAGAVQGLVSGVSAKLPFATRVRTDAATCTGCGSCSAQCHMRAITVEPEAETKVDLHLCDSCLDCVKGCPSGSMRYGRPS